MTNIGYGVDTTKVTWKKEAYKLLTEEAIKLPIFHDEFYQRRIHACNYEDQVDLFVEYHQNDSYCWDGFEGLLVDFINLKEYHGEPVFRYEHFCIYVQAYIPVDEKERDESPTQVDIQRILSKYLSELMEEPATVEWLVIS